MATLSIREYEHIALVPAGNVLAPKEPAVGTQTVAIGGTSTQAVTFSARTHFVRLHTDVACSVEFGLNPTAAAGTCNLSADQTEYFGVEPGHTLAVIAI